MAASSPRPTPPRPDSVSRRSSSSATHPTSSPKLMKKSSRSSLCAGGDAQEQERRPTPKRSISNLISGLRDAQTTMESIEEPIPLTAHQIAMEHFARELASHTHEAVQAETMVILHDACYGHRFSRQKTTKTMLSMIVERPERIHASVLGASAAYVRLGAHHEGGTNAPHPDRKPAGAPPFKIRRTGRMLDITSAFVTNVHGTAWMGELKGMCDKAGERLSIGAKELSRSATPTEPEKRKLHEGDLYLAPESLHAFQGALGGVADAVDAVFSAATNTSRAFVAVRPPGHHCSADYPSGFCWINNVHVGIEYAAQTYGLTHAAILDFDLHHGDGSQAITWQRNSKNNVKRQNAKPNSKTKLSPDIGYYSLHDINSYPCEMGDDEKVQAASLCINNAHGQSIWNIHLEAWKTEDEFWQLYETRYMVLLEKARKFLQHHTAKIRSEGKVQPRAAVFISAGFDASEWEGEGMQRHKVNVPTEFYARFTKDVVRLAQETDSGCEGRVVSVLEGGYSDRALCSGVLSHLAGLCATNDDISPAAHDISAAAGLDQMMRGLGINDTLTRSLLPYDKQWWSAANLHALGMKVNPPPPPGPGKKVRTGPQPTYATPTESFAYKVVDANKFARSISGTMREAPRPVRPPTPPPPSVDWVIATQELSKLLIPTDRQTRSCTAEELGGVRVKKEPTSVLLDPATEQPRQLRDRRSKAPSYASSVHSDEIESVRSVSRSSRRETFAGFTPAVESAIPAAAPARRVSRRVSSGATLTRESSEIDPAPTPPVPALPVTRPPTSNGAMRPPTVGNGVAVKKTRPPVKSRATNGTASTVPASRPTTSQGISKPMSAVSRAVNGNVPAQLPADVSVNGGIDALTTGMKKVTLKAGSREEHEMKQKEKLDAERRARALKGAETRRVNAAAKKAAAAARESGMGVPSAVTPAIAQAMTAATDIVPSTMDEEPSVVSATESEEPKPLPPATPLMSAAQPAELSAPSAITSTVTASSALEDEPQLGPSVNPNLSPMATPQRYRMVPSMPPPAKNATPRKPSLPISATPGPLAQSNSSSSLIPDSAARQLIGEAQNAVLGYHDAVPGAAVTEGTAASPPRPLSSRGLPIWSSTGTIPFAPAPARSASAMDIEMAMKLEPTMEDPGSVWDVPGTPMR